MIKDIFKKTIFVGLFLVPFIPFLVFSSFFFPYITTKAFTWRIIVEVVFAAWLILAVWEPEYRPKKSILLYSVFTFLAVIGLADLFGVDRSASFWSNFERMEGYISLLHLGAFFLVISSVFKEEHWKSWWNTSLVASAIMGGYAFMQIIGAMSPSQGGVRVDGTFGNAIYLAVYMLIHIFIALFYMLRGWKNRNLRWTYGILVLFQIFIIYYTATRGAILGLLGGLFIVALINVMNKEDTAVRKASMALIAAIVVLIGGFFLAKNTTFVSQSPVLSRFSTLTLAEIKNQGRYYVWPIALEGFKEKPILGWGQENFGYVFQKHYKPEMYRLEPWFDRAHNIFLDWAVVGGILGLLSYLGLYAAFLYIVWRREDNFTFSEKSVLTGLLAAYFFHNFFVFDHLTSYVLFFSLLAYLQSRVPGQVVSAKIISDSKIKKIALPAVALVLAFSLSYINFKPLLANVYLIEALKSIQLSDSAKASGYFEKAYKTSKLGRLEVMEHMANNISSIFSGNLSSEEKGAFYAFSSNAAKAQAEFYTNSARTQLMAGSFFSDIGLPNEARPYFERARELSPGKQQAYFELGAIRINLGDPVGAQEFFKEAYELSPDYVEARIIYFIGAIYTGDRGLERELAAQIPEKQRIFDDRVVSALFTNKRFSELIALFERRKELDPQNSATYDDYIRQIKSQ